MLRNRIAASSAIMLLLCAGSAAAQTASDQQPGSPLQLLQMLKRAVHPEQETAAPRAKPHGTLIARRTTHGRIAAAKRHTNQTETASAAPATDAWPTANPEPQVGTFVTEPATPDLREVVVAGQTVKIAASGDVNEIDLAAGAQDAPPAAPAPTAGATTAQATNSASGLGAKADSLVSAAPEPSASSAQQAAASAQQPANEVGSAAWIAQVLAALGGAVAAGSAAWFLMAAAPQRTYG